MEEVVVHQPRAETKSVVGCGPGDGLQDPQGYCETESWGRDRMSEHGGQVQRRKRGATGNRERERADTLGQTHRLKQRTTGKRDKDRENADGALSALHPQATQTAREEGVVVGRDRLDPDSDAS